MTIYKAREQPNAWNRDHGSRHEAQYIIDSVGKCVDGYYTTTDILDVVRSGLIKAIKKFNSYYHTKKITINELNSHWFNVPIESHCVLEYGFGWGFHKDVVALLDEVKVNASILFRNTFGRPACRDDINFAYYECFHSDAYRGFITSVDYMSRDCKEKWDYSIPSSHPDFKPEYFDTMVEVGKCIICGEPVMAHDPGTLHDAGTISMSFGYGSRRDTESATGFIHDYCSFVFDQKMTSRRLFWNSPLDGRVYPLDFEKSGKDHTEWVFDESKFNSADKMRSIRATNGDIDSIFNENE